MSVDSYGLGKPSRIGFGRTMTIVVNNIECETDEELKVRCRGLAVSDCGLVVRPVRNIHTKQKRPHKRCGRQHLMFSYFIYLIEKGARITSRSVEAILLLTYVYDKILLFVR